MKLNTQINQRDVVNGVALYFIYALLLNLFSNLALYVSTLTTSVWAILTAVVGFIICVLIVNFPILGNRRPRVTWWITLIIIAAYIFIRLYSPIYQVFIDDRMSKFVVKTLMFLLYFYPMIALLIRTSNMRKHSDAISDEDLPYYGMAQGFSMFLYWIFGNVLVLGLAVIPMAFTSKPMPIALITFSLSVVWLLIIVYNFYNHKYFRYGWSIFATGLILLFIAFIIVAIVTSASPKMYEYITPVPIAVMQLMNILFIIEVYLVYFVSKRN